MSQPFRPAASSPDVGELLVLAVACGDSVLVRVSSAAVTPTTSWRLALRSGACCLLLEPSPTPVEASATLGFVVPSRCLTDDVVLRLVGPVQLELPAACHVDARAAAGLEVRWRAGRSHGVPPGTHRRAA